MPEEEDNGIDMDTVDGEMADESQRIMDWNSRMMAKATRAARRLLKVADTYDALAARTRDLAYVHIATAEQLAGVAADLMIAEFDAETVSYEDLEDEDEDEDDED